MVNARIIPGVQVSVVKEVVPRQLSPSGVLGLVGLPEKSDSSSVMRAASWSRFTELFGHGSAYSMPEARQAFDNGVFEIVVSSISPIHASRASVILNDLDGKPLFRLEARAPGIWANGVKVAVTEARGQPGMRSFDLSLQVPGAEPEVHRRVTATPGTPRYLVEVLQNSSSIATATAVQSLPGLLVEFENPTELEAGTQRRSRGEPQLTLKDTLGEDVLKITALPDRPSLAATVNRTSNGASVRIYQRDGDNWVEATPQNDYVQDDSTETELVATIATPGTNELMVEPKRWPAPGNNFLLEGGSDASPSAYRDALQRLENEPDIDMVLAAVQDFRDKTRVTDIYSAVISHCNNLSDDCKGRIGFGQVPPTGELSEHVEMANSLVSDRFVLVAPHGVVGAVAGLIGGLPYFHSPTFKGIAGLGTLTANLGVEDQRELLRGNIVPVAVEHGIGLVVIRGLSTDGDQISVRRVADRAVRGVKARGDLFIGRLNDLNSRNALRQKLVEFLLQMEKDGAIVPSTDGSDPAFKVDVYSSQNDFALGIVRVDLAVRPVRAIDYIYATILVQV